MEPGDRFLWDDTIWSVTNRTCLIRDEGEALVAWNAQSVEAEIGHARIEMWVRITTGIKLKLFREAQTETKEIELFHGDVVVLKNQGD